MQWRWLMRVRIGTLCECEALSEMAHMKCCCGLSLAAMPLEAVAARSAQAYDAK